MPTEGADRRRILKAWSDGIRPEPQTTVSAWADAHRRLPTKTSAEPGPWRTSRTPYLREIMDELSTSSPTEEVVVMAAAQLGKSEGILNGLGYLIDCAPSPAMLVQPTVDLGKRFSRQRVDPLMATPRLKGKVSKAASSDLSRDAANSMVQKEFMGGVLVITGANSAAGLRSMPVRWLLLDEIDAYPVDVDGEGNPIDLAEARQRTFARRKRIKCSTPTVAGRSAIEAAYAASDRRRYHVPCPHCGTMQTLVFGRLTWTALGLEPKDAVYQCGPCQCEACANDPERQAEGCGLYIEERSKTEMLARGVWIAGNPDSPVRGYHINALYSPLGWMRWGEIAEGFLKARKDPLKLRVWTNTVLGEPFAEKGEAPEWERLYNRRAGYALSTVPAGGLFLTAGVDVQKDRLVYEVVAWGRGKRSWSVDFGEIPGNTDDLDGPSSPWRGLNALLDRGFESELGTRSILMLAVDSGFNTQHVYTWARTHSMGRVIAIKGQDHGALIGAPSPVDITLRGKRPIKGYKVWPVCGGVAKRELYGFLSLEAPLDASSPALDPPAGWCEWPEYGPDYFKQLTAEQLVTVKNRRGFLVQTWEVLPGRVNHALDARVYARAAAALVGLDRFRESDWQSLEGLAPRPAKRDNPPTPGTPAALARRRPSGWLGGRRGDRGGGWFKR